jgi:hypothetical protein
MSKFSPAQWSAGILWTCAVTTLAVEVSLSDHPDYLRSFLLIITAAAVSATVVASAHSQTNAVEAAFRLGLALGCAKEAEANRTEGKPTPE